MSIQPRGATLAEAQAIGWLSAITELLVFDSGLYSTDVRGRAV